MGGDSVRKLGLGRRILVWANLCSHDGDLSAADNRPTDPFFSFSLDEYQSSTMEIPQTLELGVGNNGIIGRRISIMTNSSGGPIAVAEGIIGWN